MCPDVYAGLRKHDVCFLVTVRAQMRLHEQFDWSKPFVPQVGLTCVRGCEVEGMLDEEGKLIEEGEEEGWGGVGRCDDRGCGCCFRSGCQAHIHW